MKIKRVFVNNRPDPQVAIFSRNRWIPLPLLISPEGQRVSEDLSLFISDTLSILRAGNATWNKLQQMADNFDQEIPEFDDRPLIPFEPLSYRDFILFEQHFIQASRGYVQRFKPWTHKIATMYEKIFGHPFPAFKPNPFWYKNPMYYMGNHLNFVTDDHPIDFPSYSEALDYELELGAIIVHPLKNATPREALKAIGGFVVLNDFSARDVQLSEMRSGFGPVKSKNFINAISSELVTADEIIPKIKELKGSVWINGEQIVETSTAGMYHSLGKAISYASLSEQIHPGELIGSGTLPGGCGMENGRWLAPGDTVVLHIDGIATLTNPIV